MTAPELKPCPFCGGKAYLRDDVSHSTAYFIGCTTEECFGEIHWGKSEAEAVSGWNTRATPLAAALAVPEVRALVEAARALGVRGLVAGWNGEGREKPYTPHPDHLSATIKTTCGAVYALDAALRGVEGQP